MKDKIETKIENIIYKLNSFEWDIQEFLYDNVFTIEELESLGEVFISGGDAFSGNKNTISVKTKDFIYRFKYVEVEYIKGYVYLNKINTD